MRNIVVGVKGTADSEPALDFALEEALRRRLPLQAVHAYSLPQYGEIPPALFPDRLREVREAAQSTAEQALHRAKERVPGGSTAAARVTVVEADPVSALLSAADSAAMLVVGCRGANAFMRGVLGSVSAACLHRSWAPVAVVPHRAEVLADRWLRSRVVVAVDGSPASLTAMSWATSQAREWGSVLTPVVVSPSSGHAPPGLRPQVRDPKIDLAATIWRHVTDAGGADLEVHPRFLVGDAADQILSILDPSDLLVMGSRGHSALASLLVGSTSTAVAEKAPCPVVVVRVGQARREIHQRSPHSSSV